MLCLRDNEGNLVSRAVARRLEVKLKFTDHVGMYMLHCHMVEHEDDGMMTQFEVVGRADPTPRPRPTPAAATDGALKVASRIESGARGCALLHALQFLPDSSNLTRDSDVSRA